MVIDCSTAPLSAVRCNCVLSALIKLMFTAPNSQSNSTIAKLFTCTSGFKRFHPTSSVTVPVVASTAPTHVWVKAELVTSYIG